MVYMKPDYVKYSIDRKDVKINAWSSSEWYIIVAEKFGIKLDQDGMGYITIQIPHEINTIALREDIERHLIKIGVLHKYKERR